MISQTNKAVTGGSFQNILRDNASTNGSELNALIVFRYILQTAEKYNYKLTGSVLEIGGYNHVGLALIFLLHGVNKYYLNNITPVENRISLAYAQNISALMNYAGFSRSDLANIIEPVAGSNDVRIRDQYIVRLSEQDAANITLPDNSINFIFSITVLEHVHTTAPLLQNCYRMLSPQGWATHVIDMRDHSNFSKPLDFLKLNQDTFTKQQCGNNRLRVNEHRREFEKAGFIINFVDHFKSLPLISDNRTDSYNILLNSFEHYYKEDINEINIWVTEEMRKSFHPRYHSFSLRDLSVLTANFVLHKKQ